MKQHARGVVGDLVGALQFAHTSTLHSIRSASWSATITNESAFATLLFGLFGTSLVPFLFVPSLLFTIVLSLPPFLLILARALTDLREVEWTLHKERDCLDEFVRNAAVYWSNLRDRPGEITSEQDVLGLVPEGIRRPANYAKALIEDVAKGKVYLIDAPQDSVLRPYRDDLEARYSHVSSFGNLSVKVGILGTFCGFIFALQHLSQLFANLSEERPEIMAMTLQNLAYAFVKSLFGLIFSIFIALRVSQLRKPLDEFYSRFDEALRFGREFINRMILADPAIHTSLVQVRNSLNQIEQRLFDHSGAVAQALHQHGELINEQTKTFTSAAQGMVNVQMHWEQAFGKLNAAAATFDQRTSEAMGRVEKGFETAAANFQVSLSSFNHAREQFVNASLDLNDTLKVSEGNWSERFEALVAEAANQGKKFGQWAAIVHNGFKTVREQMNVIDTNLRAAYGASQSTSDASKDLTAAIGRLDQTLRQHSNDLASLRLAKWGWERWLIVLIVTMVIAAVISMQYFGDPLQIKQNVRVPRWGSF